MTQAQAARQFAEAWQNRGDEKQDTQTFWRDLLQIVFSVEHPDIQFEKPVKVQSLKTGVETQKYIDGYLPQTKILIEQKGKKINLNKPEVQSDGSFLTPYQQARRYDGNLPRDERSRYIVVCNFQEFRIHDMNRPNDPPEILHLSDLEKESYRLQFLVDTGKEHLKREMEVSMAAGELVGQLYDALYQQYQQPMSAQDWKDLNILCVRLVFCLYAEDAEIFGSHGMFYDYLNAYDTAHTRKALKDLFAILDTKPEDRDPYLEEDLKVFPYVNGGLFSRRDVVIPQFTDEIRDLLLTKASAGFDWSEISPTIFGAVFESTLNPETRRKGGMHYTSIENIHKVIDPLFLDALREEWEGIKAIPVPKEQKKQLEAFQKKLASRTFFDPACGSGNFLTETYLSLRRLENEVIAFRQQDQIILGGVKNPIQVSIGQFYGIEINDFAVTVAKTALWIAESQMMKETEAIVRMNLDFLPLTTNANITEGNALQVDWEDLFRLSPFHKAFPSGA